MAREYLYRAKRIDNEKWVCGDLIHGPYGTAIQYCKEEIRDTGDCAKIIKKKAHKKRIEVIEVLVIPQTVCQYTGLPDKNDKKIFEWDICKYYNPEDKDGIAIVNEDYAAWISGPIRKENFMTPLFYLQRSEEWEVIGNVFDNPELLSGAEQVLKEMGRKNENYAKQ